MTRTDLKKISRLFFTSRVRIKIMKLFFQHPVSQYHMREIARLTGEQINAVRRELLLMEKSEFLLSKRDGIKKFFVLNPGFPFYNELRSIIMKSYSLGHYIFKFQKKIGNIKFAILTHTYLNSEKSDPDNPDLLIVGEPNIGRIEEIIRKASEEQGKEIHYIGISEQELNTRKKRQEPLVYSLMVLPRSVIIGKDEDFVM